MDSPVAVYPVSAIRDIERSAQAALPPGTLMQRAGRGAARLAQALIADTGANARVLVLAGPGNNGGDALETACLLARAGWQPSVLLLADPAKLPEDARRSCERARQSGVHFLSEAGALAACSSTWELVIDGLFGIGLSRPISGLMREVVEAVNMLTCPVLALDTPSGLDADTGNVVGENGVAVKATHTITFIADKAGLHTGAGRDHAGDVTVDALEIEARHFASPARAHLNSPAGFAGFLRTRPHNSHKGSFGDVVILGGAQGMTGAPILSARAAAKCGSGRVFVAFIGDAPAYDCQQPELMCRRACDMEFASATVVAGPGMGTSTLAHDLLEKLLSAATPAVLDADALNLIATQARLQGLLAQRQAATILTPHPLEAARLLQISTKDVQGNRLAAARSLAQRYNSVVVLKGSGSIIARPDGQVAINTTGNPALATAGTGDVLAGVCGALLAQGLPPFIAAQAAVWLHGKAADVLVAQGIGPIGLTASELLPVIRTLLNETTVGHA